MYSSWKSDFHNYGVKLLVSPAKNDLDHILRPCSNCNSYKADYRRNHLMSTAIHKEIDFKAGPQCVYDALLDASKFSAFTGGAPAEIQREAGGAFSCFGGMVTGRNLELVPDRRIVQAWRIKIWPEGEYSIVAFELQAHGSGTHLTMEHKGFPDAMRAHLNGEMPDGGWNRQYWEPL